MSRSFTGSISNYLHTDDNALYIDFNTPYTVAMWIKPRDVATFQFLFTNGSNNSGTAYKSLTVLAAGGVRCGVRDGGSSFNADDVTTVLEVDEWVPVIGVFESGTGNLLGATKPWANRPRRNLYLHLTP